MEPTVEIIPRPRTVFQPRVVGPGRRERDYIERVRHVESELARERGRCEHAARELDTAARLERACQRHIDRLEVRVADERERTERSEAAQKRLLLAVGALQQENEALRARLNELPAARRTALAGSARTPRPSLWSRWFGARRPRA